MRDKGTSALLRAKAYRLKAVGLNQAQGTKPLPAKAGRLLFRLKVDLRLKPPEGLPAGSGLKATAGALL